MPAAAAAWLCRCLALPQASQGIRLQHATLRRPSPSPFPICVPQRNKLFSIIRTSQVLLMAFVVGTLFWREDKQTVEDGARCGWLGGWGLQRARRHLWTVNCHQTANWCNE